MFMRKQADRQALLIMHHVECSDSLCDSTSFVVSQRRVSQRIQQRSFAMVNVPHHTDHWLSVTVQCLVQLHHRGHSILEIR